MAQVPAVSVDHPGDGVTTIFGFDFPYQKADEIFVTVDDVPVAYVFTAGSAFSVEVVPAPALGTTVTIYRSTLAYVPLHEFDSGVPFLPRYVDENNRQLLYAVQEGISYSKDVSDEALLAAQNALGVANDIDAKAQQALDLASGVDDKASQALAQSTQAQTVAAAADEKAQEALDLVQQAGVASFNGRTGAVIPVAGDYDAAQVKRGAGTVEASLAALEAAVAVPVAQPNRFINGSMRINQRMGDIVEFGAKQIANHPFRWASDTPAFMRPDGSYEDRAFKWGVTLDRWLVYMNENAATGGTGYIEQVKCIDAPLWVAGTNYGEGAVVRAPAGLYGAGYVYRCVAPHTAAGWNADVKTPTAPGNWQQLPARWALYGIYETDPALQNKYALHWVQLTGSTSPIYLAQFILGTDWVKSGKYSMSFLAKNRAGADVPTRAHVIQSRGAGQPANVSTSVTQPITGTAQRFVHEVMLQDSTTGIESGINGNNRLACVKARVAFPNVGQTFDLLITDIQFQEGGATVLTPPSYVEDLHACQAYYRASGPMWYAARNSSYVADAVAGTPQYNVIDYQNIWDRYGRILNAGNGQSVNWGGTNRAYPNNEREITGSGKSRAMVERLAKAHPQLETVTTPGMIRPPTVRVYDVIGGCEGYGTYNNRFKAALKFDGTGAGASARPFAQRSLCKIAVFGATTGRFDFQSQNFYEADLFEDVSTSRTVPGGQDAIGSSFLTLFGGYRYDWVWKQSTTGTDVYYLTTGNTTYYKNGAGSLIALPNWSAGAKAIGDVVRVAGTDRVYECTVAHTDTTAPTETSMNWRPYGRITMPYNIKLDGTLLGRANIAAPGALTGNQWWFGDNDSLGFSTLYVRMNSAPPSPGSATGRVTVQSYDNNPDILENILFHWIADAEILTNL